MNKKLIILIVSILLIAFFWFEIRPAEIIKSCHKEALERSVLIYSAESYPDVNERGRLQEKDQKYSYDSCLKKNGIKK